MDADRAAQLRPVLRALLINVVVPLALFYGMRAVGFEPLVALFAGAVLPAAAVVHTAVRRRRIDALAVVVLATMTVLVVVAAITGDARALLARESVGTAVLGAVLLGSLLTSRPAILALVAEVMPQDDAQRMLSRWAHEQVFRRCVVRVTVLWGAAFLIDAVARIWMAYSLPVDVVPGAGSVLVGVLLLAAVLASRGEMRVVARARSDA